MVAEEHIIEVLRHHFMDRLDRRTPPCPVCGTDDWVVIGLHILLPYDGEKVIPGAKVVPLVVLICKKCSNTLFVPWVPMEWAWRKEHPNAT